LIGRVSSGHGKRELGKDSPLYTILRVDPATDATSLMIDFPTALHIPKHTHDKSETHIILCGSHLFENNDTGERFDVRVGGTTICQDVSCRRRGFRRAFERSSCWRMDGR
jgi:hypothetical protein